MRFAQISDTHISSDAPERLADLERCVAQINALIPAPDAVIHTGDVSHNGLTTELSVARSALERLRCPYFVIPGNKDPRRTMLDAFFDGTSPGGTDSFIQYAVEAYDVRLILLDTRTSASNKGGLCRERLADLDAMVARDTSRSAAIFMHHPPIQVPVGPDAIQFVDPNDLPRFASVVAQHSNIHGIFCGHVHRPTSGTICRSVVSGTIPVTVMTASALDRRFGETVIPTDETPLYRVHDYPSKG